MGLLEGIGRICSPQNGLLWANKFSQNISTAWKNIPGDLVGQQKSNFADLKMLPTAPRSPKSKNESHFQGQQVSGSSLIGRWANLKNIFFRKCYAKITRVRNLLNTPPTMVISRKRCLILQGAPLKTSLLPISWMLNYEPYRLKIDWLRY